MYTERGDGMEFLWIEGTFGWWGVWGVSITCMQTNVQWPAYVAPRYPLWPSELECPSVGDLWRHPRRTPVIRSQQIRNLRKWTVELDRKRKRERTGKWFVNGLGYRASLVGLPLHLFVVLSSIALVEMIVPYLEKKMIKQKDYVKICLS